MSSLTVLTETPLPDYLSLVRRVRISCGCVRGVDVVSGLAVVDQSNCTRQEAKA